MGGTRRYSIHPGGASRPPRDEGAAIVLVAIALLLLMAAVALAIDTGFAFVERRQAQNAADLAAMAAAFAECGGADAQAAADSSVSANGYTPAHLTLTHHGGAEYKARVQNTIDTNFGGVIGIDTVTVAGVATADCVGGSGSGNAIFAGGDNCVTESKPQFESPGSIQEVWGGIHSNGFSRVGGSTNDFGAGNPATDPFTYVAGYQEGGSGNGYDVPMYPAMTGMQPWPLGYGPTDISSTLATFRTLALSGGPGYFYSTSKIDSISADGLYFADTSEGIDVSSIAPGVTKLTLVSTGPIKLSASGANVDPYDYLGGPAPPAHLRPILLYSGHQYGPTSDESCDKFTVALSGSTSNWTGIVGGPGGLVEFSGSSNSALSGSLIGWSVRLNGSDITIHGNPDLFPGEKITRLIR